MHEKNAMEKPCKKTGESRKSTDTFSNSKVMPTGGPLSDDEMV